MIRGVIMSIISNFHINRRHDTDLGEDNNNYNNKSNHTKDDDHYKTIITMIRMLYHHHYALTLVIRALYDFPGYIVST